LHGFTETRFLTNYGRSKVQQAARKGWSGGRDNRNANAGWENQTFYEPQSFCAFS
jgi:hypothetical protein